MHLGFCTSIREIKEIFLYILHKRDPKRFSFPNNWLLLMKFIEIISKSRQQFFTVLGELIINRHGRLFRQGNNAHLAFLGNKGENSSKARHSYSLAKNFRRKLLMDTRHYRF